MIDVYICIFADWNSPVDLTSTGGSTGSSDPTQATVTWQIMPPHLFRPMEVPFDLPGKTDEIPCPLPEPYLHAMTAKKE